MQIAVGGCMGRRRTPTSCPFALRRRLLSAPCFSSDLQQVTMKFVVLYRIPEGQVINVYRQYHGDPFSILVLPRAQEAVKEVTANKTAEHMVKKIEAVKSQALAALQAKVGESVVIEDLVIEDIELSRSSLRPSNRR